MEPIGQKFKDARKEKGLFIEQVARETNISKKYIEAIEEENFSDFPGETYLLGFLRSYAGYLGLDAEEIITIYKKTKIQEQPVPAELIEPESKLPPLPVMLAGVALIAILGAGFLVYKSGIVSKIFSAGENSGQLSDPAAAAGTASGTEYEMNSSFIERRFAEGDSVTVKYREQPYRITVSKTGETVTLIAPSGKLELPKGREALTDLDGDGSSDIKIMIRDVDPPGRAAVIKFDRNIEAPSVASSEISSEKELSDVSIAAVAATETQALQPSGSTRIQTRREPERVIFESDEKKPFTINLSFRGYCLMRYESDGGRREERYFHKGETFRIDVSQNIKIWLSNASALTATVSGAEYLFGNPGAVSAKVIGWSEKPEGGYAVKALPLY